MLVTLFGIRTSVRLEHLENVDASMHVTLLGMVMLFSSQQDANAPPSILVTLSGILTPVSS